MITNRCKSYFNGFEEISNFKKNSMKINVLASSKIVSYFTIVIPLAVAATYCAASLYGRISKKDCVTSCNRKITSQTKKTIINYQEKVKPVTPVLHSTVSKRPEIESDGWGEIIVGMEGKTHTFKDVIILSSEDQQIAAKWNWAWSSEAMHHKPGIRICDIDQLILANIPKPDVIILTQGRGHGRGRENPGPGELNVAPKVYDYIKQIGVKEVYILKTAAAIDKYKEICFQGDRKSIAALIHTTC